VFLDAWFETRFHQAVMRLLSIKCHFICSGIVWVFLIEFFNHLSDSIKKLTTVLVKKGPSRLGSRWEERCGLPSVDNHDLV